MSKARKMAPTHTNIFVPTIETIGKAPAPKSIFARMLAWVVAKDQAYKAECHIENLSEETLKDVGLKR